MQHVVRHRLAAGNKTVAAEVGRRGIGVEFLVGLLDGVTPNLLVVFLGRRVWSEVFHELQDVADAARKLYPLLVVCELRELQRRGQFGLLGYRRRRSIPGVLRALVLQ